MKKYFILAIVALAFVLRFYNLGSYPALNADEAALGYNAYSLLQTGKDEHGNAWPIHFQSFNDYKPGLYVYMIMPFVGLFGLNEWSVRIPAAFLAVATVYLVYLLVKKGENEKTALIASLLLAISPWHIHFSRGGWETSVATFFITLAVFLFLKAIENPKYYLFSLVSFVASLYTYHSARLVVPVIGLALVLLNLKTITKSIKRFSVAIAIAAVLCIPLAVSFFGNAGLSRASGVGILADMGPTNLANEQRGEHNDLNSIFVKALHNKAVNYALAFGKNWLSHYNGEFLFLSGDEIQRNRVPETGQLYTFELITVLSGLFILLKRSSKDKTFLLMWLLVAPLAAALTFQSPHALRAHNMVIPITIISAFGLSYIIDLLLKIIKNKSLLKLTYLFISIVVIWSFARYMHMYWTHMSKEYPFSSQYGIKELVSYVSSQKDDFKHIVVTDRYDQPYILFLFYLRYPPSEFQKNHELSERDQYGFSTVREFDKYKFISITNWDSLREQFRDSLIAGTDEEIYHGTNVVKKIYGSNGHMYFEIVRN